MPAQEELHQHAADRVMEFRGFGIHVGLYLLANFNVFMLWALGGGGTYRGWWLAAGWGIGLAIHGVSLIPSMVSPPESYVEGEMRLLAAQPIARRAA